MTNNQHGFTLIEFLVAIVILMVGLLGMLQAVDLAMDKNLETAFRTEAIMVADDVMMRLRTSSYDSVVTTVVPPVTRNIQGIFKNYSVQQTVYPRTTQSKEIRIRVSWRKKNTRYNHYLSSMITTY